MIIAHVVESMDVGGAEVLVASLCRLQSESGHQPLIYCLYRVGVLGEQLRREGFTVRHVEPSSRLGKARASYGLFREDRVQAAHFHNAEATILCAAPARLAGVRRTVSTRHGLVDPPYHWKRETQYAAASYLVDAVAAVCRKAERNLKGIPMIASGRVLTVYNGCAASRRAGEVDLFATGSNWRVVQVGRLAVPKDPACLIEAAAILAPEIPGLDVVFVGDGKLRSEMQQLVQSRGLEKIVRFAGERSNIGDWLDQADQFVLASRSEGVPVSILEAMEAGLPIAASDVGGIAEVVPGNPLSALAPAGDATGLASAVREAWHHRNEGIERRTAIRAHYNAGFTLEQMAARYQELYQG